MSSSTTAPLGIDCDSVTDVIALLGDFALVSGVMLFVEKRTRCVVPCCSGFQAQETKLFGKPRSDNGIKIRDIFLLVNKKEPCATQVVFHVPKLYESETGQHLCRNRVSVRPVWPEIGFHGAKDVRDPSRVKRRFYLGPP